MHHDQLFKSNLTFCIAFLICNLKISVFKRNGSFTIDFSTPSTVAILITYCKLFIEINKSSFDENVLFITNPKSEVQVKLMTE
jgi:hypothetical protein